MNTDEAIASLQHKCDELGLPFSLSWDYDNYGQLVIYTDAYLVSGEWLSGREISENRPDFA